MAGFMDDGERAAQGWRLAARLAPDAPTPLRVELAGQRLLVFHGGTGRDYGAPGDDAVVCVVAEDCGACGASRAAAHAWRARDPAQVRCPGCGAVETVDADTPAWPVMCVDDEVYVYVDTG